MKVLLVDQNSSINWKYTYSLANALFEDGVDISVVTDLATSKGICKGKTIPLFNTDLKNVSKVKKLTNYVHSYKAILKLIKSEHIDILHLEWPTFSPVDYFYIKKAKKLCKVVMTIHDIIAFDAHFYDKSFMKKVYSLPDALILQTEDNVERFKKLFPMVSPDKIHMAYHGHYLDFADVHGKEESRQKLNLPQDKFIYMFFGQIKKVKGVDLLIKAFAEVQKKNPNVFLLIAGKVWHNDYGPYEELIASLGIGGSCRSDIKFIPDEDVGFYFSACDIVCLPYTELFQSGVVQLSYAYKKPAIVSNLSPFLTVVKDGETGLSFVNGNFLDLSQKMGYIFENKELIGVMGQKGYDFIKEKYSWQKIAHIIHNEVYCNSMKNS
jgi:D-inositol-3-phosphate glycosyltransferase